MADYLDRLGFPMTVAEYLYIGAPDDDCAAADAHQQAEEPDSVSTGLCSPRLSCAICGDYAGTALVFDDHRVEEKVALMNTKALCFMHWDRWHMLFRRRLDIPQFIAQERARINPPSEAAA